jgi:hypothetical protein
VSDLSPVKKCRECHEILPLVDFYPRRRVCRPCVHRKARLRARKKRGTLQSVQGWLAHYYSGRSCLDCGVAYPYCAMDFDHRPDEGKLFTISSWNSLSTTRKRLTELRAEVAKCDYICSNCHRIRTFNRKNEELDDL